MLNGVFQRPYTIKDERNPVKKKQDDEQTRSAQKERQTDENSKSKGLQYTQQNNSVYKSKYPELNQEQQVDWRQMRSQIQIQAQANKSAYAENATLQKPSENFIKNSTINIAQILKDFKNTAAAIGTPADLKEEVNGYLSLIETQVKKDNPNIRLIKSNLKNASSILDNFISQTLNKESKVVENWVDALFLQQIDFKYNESDINPQFLVKFPEGSTQNEENAEIKTAVKDNSKEPIEQQLANENKVQSIIPKDKELKSLFIKSKKLAYTNNPQKAIETFKTALERADEVGDTETKAKIYYEVGVIYDDHDYLAQALTSYNNALQNTKDNNVKVKAHYSMAQIYDDVNQIQPALDHYFSSVAFAGETDNLAAQSTSLTKMGNIYTDMYEQEGLKYYQTANELANQIDNYRVKGFVCSGLAGAYEKFGEPQEALKSYSDAVKNYTEAEAPLKVAQNYYKAAEIMQNYGNISKTKSLLQKAQNFARQTDDVNLMNEINSKLSALL